jgi:hypothetical protein
MLAVAASQLFTNMPKLVSVLRLPSAKMLGAQALDAAPGASRVQGTVI